MSKHATSPTRLPVPKVVAAALGSAVAAIVLWAVEAATAVDVPTFVEGAIVTLCTFAAGYLKRPAGELYDDAAALRHREDGRALLGTLGVVLLVLATALTVTTLLGVLLGVLVVSATVITLIVATFLCGVVLLLVDGSTPSNV